MHIGSGPSPLSLAVMKALGAQSATPAAGATASSAAASKPAVAARPTAAGDLSGGPGDLGVAKNIPRGSFVNLRV